MAITRVQYVSTASAGGATSLSATLASTAAGNLLVAVVAVGSTTSNGTCATPSGWTLAVGPVTTESGAVSDINLYIFYKVDVSGGTTSVTFTDTVSSGITIQVWEWHASSGWPASPLDVTASSANQASTTSPVTGTTATTAQAEEVWIGALSTHFATGESYTAPLNGFTVEAVATAGASAFFAPTTGALYKIVAATGTASTGATASTAKPFAGAIATFKDNAGNVVAGDATFVSESVLRLTTTRLEANSVLKGTASAIPQTANTVNLSQPVAEYAVRIRNAARQLVGEIRVQNALFTLRYNNVGAWAIQVDANDPLAGALAADGAGIQVLRTLRDPASGDLISSSVLLSGPRWGRVRQMAGRTLIASGYDDLLWLQGRLAYPAGTYNGTTHVFSAAYDTRTGAAETVIRGYVDANAVTAGTNPLGQSRVVSGLTLAADSGRGASVTGNARFDQLLMPDGTGLLQQLAQSGGLGFKVTQSGTNLLFSQYVPTDRTASVIFSQALGNLADFSYQEDGPDFTQGGNGVLVGGGGQLASRVFIARDDATSISRWGLFEGFADARDTSDVPTLQQRGDAQLAQAAISTQFACTLAPQRAIVYGQDFNVGDNVTVVIDGVSFANIVREVQIKLDTTGAETVTPAVGSPNADTIRRLFGGYVQQHQLASITSTTSKLARSQ